MFFFDLDEPTLLWRGIIDKTNKKIIDGVVIANKKRFGIFPYTLTLSTQALPCISIVNSKHSPHEVFHPWVRWAWMEI